ncbi:MAG: hypothetical protein LBN94_01550, partial [Puniceicoccales bacterium]|nr:hypothetical protein [Puniceicoccales bacterium]
MKRIHSQQKTQRIAILGIFFSLVFLFLACGLFYRQIIQHDYFLQKEKRQNQRRIILPAPRGNIYDRNGKLMVCNRPSFDLNLYFDDIRQEIRREYTLLTQRARKGNDSIDRLRLQQRARENVVERHLALANEITGRRETLNTRTLERHYRESLPLPFTLLSNLSPEEYARLINHLPSPSPLHIATNYHRFYPYNNAACHVLGYVTFSRENTFQSTPLKTFQCLRNVGKTGIELAQNQSLTGTNGEEIFSIDPSGFRADCIHKTSPKKGQDCRLSIDIDLQVAMEKELEKLGNRRSGAVMIDVNSGEILAMVSRPNYDANLLGQRITPEIFQKISESGAWTNRALQGVYPPGSIFKIISSIAFLRHRISSWNDRDFIECPGYTKIGNHTFNCDQLMAHGKVTLAKALEKSCNVYYYLRSQICGIDNIIAEAKRFHLDRRTAIDLPFETERMLIPTPDWKEKKGFGKWFPGDTANTSIGQGYVLVSPLQMACFMASLAKNRTQTIPHILHDENHRQDSSPPIGLDNGD